MDESGATAGSRLRALVARYTALLATIGVVVFGAFFVLDRLYERWRFVEANRATTQALLVLELNEETSIRGFARTHDRSFLAPYLAAVGAIQTTIDDLAKRLSSSPDELPEVARFGDLHARWQRDYAQPILQSRPANVLAREQRGKLLVDGMRSSITRIDSIENSHLAIIQPLVPRFEYAVEGIVVLAIAVVGALGYMMERRAMLRELAFIEALTAQRDAAARIGEWRSKVIGMLAHDFRSQLSVVEATATLLEEFPDPKEQRRRFAIIHRSVAQLTTMSEDAALLTRFASDTFVINADTLPIFPILDEIAERYRSERPIDIEGINGTVAGERSYLLRVFDNLVSNAVKYSYAESRIKIRVRPFEGITEIAVSDFGPGIDPRFLPHIFDAYVRAPGFGKVDGHGLGLYIVKRLVEAHGGTIDVDNRPRSGVTVYVRLPSTIVHVQNPIAAPAG